MPTSPVLTISATLSSLPTPTLETVRGLQFFCAVGFIGWSTTIGAGALIHAGAKIVNARVADGSTKKYGMLFFGLSGTGKTTHACHGHELNAPGESMDILQDDIVSLGPDGRALGTERGFYMKTEGMHPETQSIITWKTPIITF